MVAATYKENLGPAMAKQINNQSLHEDQDP